MQRCYIKEPPNCDHARILSEVAIRFVTAIMPLVGREVEISSANVHYLERASRVWFPIRTGGAQRVCPRPIKSRICI